MAPGRNAPHIAAAERPSAADERSLADTADTNHTTGTNQAAGTTRGPADTSPRTAADTERLGIDVDVTDRPAHAWEVGEADSWETSVTDAWNPPPSGTTPRVEPDGAELNVAELDRGEPNRGEADSGEAVALPADRSVPPAVPPTERAVRSARQALQQALRISEQEPELDPARMAVSLASLAAERMRAGVPAGDGLVTGLGLARQTANGLLALGQRLFEPASRIASGAVRNAARLPVAGRPVRAALRSGQWLARSGAEAREKLRASIDSARGLNRATVDAGAGGWSSLSTDDRPQRTSTPSEGAAASRL